MTIGLRAGIGPLGIAALGITLSFFGGRAAGLPAEALVIANLAVAAALTVYVKKKTPSVLDPGFLLGVAFLVHYGIGSLVAYVWPKIEWTNPLLSFWISDSVGTSGALFITLLGGLGWLAGIMMIRYRRTRPVTVPPGAGSTNEVVILLVFGHVLSLLFLHRLPVSVRGLLTVPALITHPFTLYCAYRVGRETEFRHRSKWLWILGASCVGLAAMNLIDGMREHFFLAFTLVLVGYHAGSGKLPRAPILAGMATGFLLLLPLLNQVKAMAFSGQDLSGVERLQIATQQSGEERGEDNIQDAVAKLAARLSLPQMAIHYVEQYPSVYDFERGRTFLLELTNFIPRTIWSDKPEVSTELNLYAKKVGVIGVGDLQTSAVFDGFTEYYVNFGYLGVFVFSFLSAMYAYGVYELSVRVLGPTIGAMAVACFIIDNNDCFGMFYQIDSHLKNILVWWLMIMLVMPKIRGVAARRISGQRSGQLVLANR